DARVAFTITGDSMEPTLRDRRDVVYLVKPTTLRRYDAALYRRESGAFILHRIVAISKDGSFVFCGDNQTYLERGIRREQIVGAVSSFERGSLRVDCRRSLLYKAYVVAWTHTRYVRKIWRAIRRRLRRSSN
ncbi:MAG: S24/S26 family peptidase, partial [Thermoguttaceae bacterium]|nr:S24/S26 family peptidase [Thermoguttaceae bacterium]